MQAAVIAASRKLEVVSTPAPSPGPGEVRVRLEGCGICASNLPVWEGREWFRYPLAPGLYYVVIDNTATAGLVSPPTSLFNPLGDAVARVSYVAQLAE